MYHPFSQQPTDDSATPSRTYLLLHLADEHFALPITVVREVLRWRVPTHVPGAPPVLPGLISHRGEIVPVLLLARLLDLPHRTPDSRTRYVLVQHTTTRCALQVDAVFDLDTITDDDIAPANSASGRLLGIVRRPARPVAILDIGALLAALHPQTA